MKRFLLATTCAVSVSAAPALAAAPFPAFSWTGCYVGAHLGGGWGQKDFTDQLLTPGGGSPTANTSGWLGGGQIGCDYQFAPHWVVGFEGSGSWADIKGSSDPFFSGKALASFSAKTEWIASATARLGYAFDRWMIYGKGGAAWAGDKYEMPGTILFTPFNYTGSETRSGWTIGGGVEWAFWENWSAKVEYAYYDFGTHSLTLVDTISGAPDPSSIKQRIQTVTFGINYHFWTGTP